MDDLIDEASQTHKPIVITGKRNNAVLLAEEDWNVINETLYLVFTSRYAKVHHCVTRCYIQGRLTMSKELIGIIGLFISLTVATASVIGVVQAGDSELRADMRIMQSQINDLQLRMSRVETKLDIAFTDATETAQANNTKTP